MEGVAAASAVAFELEAAVHYGSANDGNEAFVKEYYDIQCRNGSEWYLWD